MGEWMYGWMMNGWKMDEWTGIHWVPKPQGNRHSLPPPPDVLSILIILSLIDDNDLSRKEGRKSGRRSLD